MSDWDRFYPTTIQWISFRNIYLQNEAAELLASHASDARDAAALDAAAQSATNHRTDKPRNATHPTNHQPLFPLAAEVESILCQDSLGNSTEGDSSHELPPSTDTTFQFKPLEDISDDEASNSADANECSSAVSPLAFNSNAFVAFHTDDSAV